MNRLVLWWFDNIRCRHGAETIKRRDGPRGVYYRVKTGDVIHDMPMLQRNHKTDQDIHDALRRLVAAGTLNFYQREERGETVTYFQRAHREV